MIDVFASWKNIVKDESSTVGNLLVMFTCPLSVLPNSLLFEVTLYVSLKYQIFLNKDQIFLNKDQIFLNKDKLFLNKDIILSLIHI